MGSGGGVTRSITVHAPVGVTKSITPGGVTKAMTAVTGVWGVGPLLALGLELGSLLGLIDGCIITGRCM